MHIWLSPFGVAVREGFSESGAPAVLTYEDGVDIDDVYFLSVRMLVFWHDLRPEGVVESGGTRGS